MPLSLTKFDDNEMLPPADGSLGEIKRGGGGSALMSR
jgi:hypothetical protein